MILKDLLNISRKNKKKIKPEKKQKLINAFNNKINSAKIKMKNIKKENLLKISPDKLQNKLKVLKCIKTILCNDDIIEGFRILYIKNNFFRIFINFLISWFIKNYCDKYS